MKTNPLVTIVVVTHSRQRELERCLASVACLTYSPFEVVVVDNASSDGTGDMVKRLFPTCRLIENRQNAGAAAGRNMGIAAAAGPYVLLVDDDCAVASESLTLMMDVMLNNPECTAVTPRIVNHFDGQAEPSVTLSYDINLWTGRLSVIRNPSGKQDPVEVPMLGGGFALMSKEVLQRVGGFDEGFFVPYEDADLSLRVRNLGYCIICNPSAVFYHWQIKSHQVPMAIQQLGIGSVDRAYYVARNKVMFICKHANPLQRLTFLLLFWPVYILIYNLVILRQGSLDVLYRYWQGVWAGLRYALGIRRAS